MTRKPHPSLAWLKADLTPESTRILSEAARLAKAFGVPGAKSTPIRPQFILAATLNINTNLCRSFSDHLSADIPEFRPTFMPILGDIYGQELLDVLNWFPDVSTPKTFSFDKDTKDILRFAKENWDRLHPNSHSAIPADYILAALFSYHKSLDFLDYALLDLAVERSYLFDILIATSKYFRNEIQEGSYLEITIGDRQKIIVPLTEESSAIATAPTAIPPKKTPEEIETDLTSAVVGQSTAISKIINVLKRQNAGLKDPNKPIGVFIFAGYTGVGKTELAKQLATAANMSLLRLDMSEYAKDHEVSRLYGAPPGYVGYEEGGKLTNFVIKNPRSVIIFDEIEKAHPKINDPLLQIVEEGSLTDGKGNNVNFRDTIIVLTTNLGVREANKIPIGFNVNADNNIAAFNNAITRHFRPELLGRIGQDNIVTFNRLDKDCLQKIARLELAKIAKRSATNNKIKIRFLSSVSRQLVESAETTLYGARGLVKSIDQTLTAPLADFILKNQQAKVISVSYRDSGYSFKKVKE